MLESGVYPTNPALPRSTATNGYELLDDVVQCILEEPKRFYMPNWIIRGYRMTDLSEFRNRERRPTCGTAACIGGWITLLALGPMINENTLDVSSVALTLALGASPNLDAGIDPAEWTEARSKLYTLFGDVTPDWIPDPDGTVDQWGDTADGHFPQTGTLEYAEQYVEKIRAFQARYAAVLKSKPITHRAAPPPAPPTEAPTPPTPDQA